MHIYMHMFVYMHLYMYMYMYMYNFMYMYIYPLCPTVTWHTDLTFLSPKSTKFRVFETRDSSIEYLDPLLQLAVWALDAARCKRK